MRRVSGLLALSLVATSVLGLLVSAQGVTATKANKQSTSVLLGKKVAEKSDFSTGWNILDWSSSTGTDVESVFVQGHVDPTTGMKSVGVNHGNLGATTLSAVKRVALKAGKTYQFKVKYFISISLVDLNETYIDFNGQKRVNQPTPGDGEWYTETITPTEDMTYQVAFKMKTLKGSTGTMMLSFDGDDAFSEVIDKPNPVKNVKNSISGMGNPGYHIVVKDQQDGKPSKQIGSGDVTDSGMFNVTTTRDLVNNETLYVYQQNDNGDSSDSVEYVVKLPEAQD